MCNGVIDQLGKKICTKKSYPHNISSGKFVLSEQDELWLVLYGLINYVILM